MNTVSQKPLSSTKLAILIPSVRWNAKSRALLASCVGIANEEIAVLIGDNSENPEKKDFLRKLRKINQNIISVSHTKNIGAFNNFFFLLDWCKDIEFYALIGDDDWMTPCYYPDALEILKKNPHVSCCEAGTALADFGDGKHLSISQPSMTGSNMPQRLKNWNAVVARITAYHASRRSTIQSALDFQKTTPIYGLTMIENLWELNRLAKGDFISTPAPSYFIHYPATAAHQGDINSRFYNLLCKDIGLSASALDFMDLSSAIQCALFLMGKLSPIGELTEKKTCGQAVFKHIYTNQFLPKFKNTENKNRIFNNIKKTTLASDLNHYISPSFTEKAILDDGLISLFIDLMDLFQVEKNTPPLRSQLKDFFSELLPQGINSLSHEDTPFTFSPELLATTSILKAPSDNTPDYSLWQSKRTMIAEEIRFIEEHISQEMPYNFHFFIRPSPGEESKIADTIDSLSGQFYPNWHLDIVTELPAPEGLNDIPCIGWHSACSEKHKAIIDNLVELRECDWCIEIPAGARLDPLYLWRLSTEAQKTPAAQCFFVDDDCFDDSTNKSRSPRFKPGSNPSALESSDLAGPICIKREAWMAIGGAAISHASPWFYQLLRISRHFGWNTIQHIPDILISYPNAFPTDTKSCTISLLEHLDYQNAKTEIIPTTGSSWAFRYHLSSLPTVTIAVTSLGRLELLKRCTNSISQNTSYPASKIRLLVVLNRCEDDRDLEAWLDHVACRNDYPIEAIRTPTGANNATRCNAAVASACSEFTLLLDEETIILEPGWLSDLVGSCAQAGIAGTTPCLIRPEANTIHHAGLVLGIEGIAIPLTGTQAGRTLETNVAMKGIAGPLYEKMAMHDNTGYLNIIKMPRDVSAMSSTCMMVRTHSYLEAGGMDDELLGDTLADVDLCLKLRQRGERLVYQPLATVGFGDVTDIEIPSEEIQRAQETLAQSKSREIFRKRWWPNAAVDPMWNPNLSLSAPIPTPEQNWLASWHYLPLNIPKILACPVDGGQGIIRVRTPVEALRKAGLAQVLLYTQQPTTPTLKPAELIRLSPDAVILHHFFNNTRIPELQSWHTTPGRPFLTFAMDDLVTELDDTNPFKKNIPPDSRSRLKKALACCDRLVVSTDYLANAYENLISDILVVPNFLEQSAWLPLRSQRRTTKKPRVGWAGGTTHQGDLVLLKEIIEQTRHEADWVFFGMCPDEIQPLLAEYHPIVAIDQYPSHLASLNLDIAVAPLAQTPFNCGKSNLRLLEYGILGLPVVCTDIAPYQNSPACLVANRPSDWIAALRERIYDADAREQEGKAMRKWVLDNYLLENNLEAWLSAHLPN